MSQKRSINLRCPTCKQTVKAGVPEFPFCSERCRLIDLGRWASGAYVISSPLPDAAGSIPDNKVEDPEDPL